MILANIFEVTDSPKYMYTYLPEMINTEKIREVIISDKIPLDSVDFKVFTSFYKKEKLKNLKYEKITRIN